MAGDPEMLLYGLYGSLFLAVLLLVGGTVWNEWRRAERERASQAFGDTLLCHQARLPGKSPN